MREADLARPAGGGVIRRLCGAPSLPCSRSGGAALLCGACDRAGGKARIFLALMFLFYIFALLLVSRAYTAGAS